MGTQVARRKRGFTIDELLNDANRNTPKRPSDPCHSLVPDTDAATKLRRFAALGFDIPHSRGGVGMGMGQGLGTDGDEYEKTWVMGPHVGPPFGDWPSAQFMQPPPPPPPPPASLHLAHHAQALPQPQPHPLLPLMTPREYHNQMGGLSWLYEQAAMQQSLCFAGTPSPYYLGMPSSHLRKPKRVRTAFSPIQLMRMEAAFEKNPYIVGQERKELATNLNLSETQVKVWFQNRRTKKKRVDSASESSNGDRPRRENNEDDDAYSDDNDNDNDNDNYNDDASEISVGSEVK